jgi:hypothetical protein
MASCQASGGVDVAICACRTPATRLYSANIEGSIQLITELKLYADSSKYCAATSSTATRDCWLNRLSSFSCTWLRRGCFSLATLGLGSTNQGVAALQNRACSSSYKADAISVCRSRMRRLIGYRLLTFVDKKGSALKLFRHVALAVYLKALFSISREGTVRLEILYFERLKMLRSTCSILSLPAVSVNYCV